MASPHSPGPGSPVRHEPAAAASPGGQEGGESTCSMICTAVSRPGLRHCFAFVSLLGAGALFIIGATGLVSAESDTGPPNAVGSCLIAAPGRCGCARWEESRLNVQFCTAYEAVFPVSFVADDAVQARNVSSCDLQLGQGSIATCLSAAVAAPGVAVANLSAPSAAERAAAIPCRLNLDTLKCFVGDPTTPTSSGKFTALLAVGSAWLCVTAVAFTCIVLGEVRRGRRRRSAEGRRLLAADDRLLAKGKKPAPSPGDAPAHYEVGALVAAHVDGRWQYARVCGASPGAAAHWDLVSLSSEPWRCVPAARMRSQSFRRGSWVRLVEDAAVGGAVPPVLPAGCLGVTIATAPFAGEPAGSSLSTPVEVCVGGITFRPAAGQVVPAAALHAGDPVLVADPAETAATEPVTSDCAPRSWRPATAVALVALDPASGESTAERWGLRAAPLDGTGARVWPLVRRALEPVPYAAPGGAAAHYVFVDPQGATAPVVMTADEVARYGGVRRICAHISEASKTPLVEFGLASSLLLAAHVAAGRKDPDTLGAEALAAPEESARGAARE
eukprot:TRINITY_DN37505_c0_g2_i2.p3 TRINITY_DN37505_c0_g2~~TRINITY_DN37505_c0_g2_i2.p3  ORF type:complete len:558 (+),score=136.31 TRINITY_DN37505_c0_g2_i2:365-2038(+)